MKANFKLTVSTFRDIVKYTIFTITFVKRDGSLRTMNAMLGVYKHVKNTQPEVTAKRTATLVKQNMVAVYEMPMMQYRTINLDTIRVLTCKGETYYFESEEEQNDN